MGGVDNTGWCLLLKSPWVPLSSAALSELLWVTLSPGSPTGARAGREHVLAQGLPAPSGALAAAMGPAPAPRDAARPPAPATQQLRGSGPFNSFC